MKRDVFQAIADPTRRKIVFILADKSLTLNSIAENFRISRPAVSKQVKFLVESGLVTVNPKGRERICSLNFDKLKDVTGWLKYFDKFWDKKLIALKNIIEVRDEG